MYSIGKNANNIISVTNIATFIYGRNNIDDGGTNHMKNRNRHGKGRKRLKAVVGLLFVLILVCSLPLAAVGFSSYTKKIPDGGASYSCNTCHTGSALNDFGVDFKDNSKKYDDVLGARDSDGDGFTNDEEFNAETVTNPGDPLSYPGANNTNATTNHTAEDSSAFIGPLDMKIVVPFFFSVMFTVVIGGLIGLVVAEFTVTTVRRARRRNRKLSKKDDKDG